MLDHPKPLLQKQLVIALVLTTDWLFAVQFVHTVRLDLYVSTGQLMQKKLSESRKNTFQCQCYMASLNPIFPEPHDVHKAVPGLVLYLPDVHDKHVLLLGVNPALHEQ